MRAGVGNGVRAVCMLAAAILASCTAGSGQEVASASSPSLETPKPAQQRPNVLFILVDDLRPDLGVYGHPTAQTPNIDALGASGIVFESAFTQQAVCGPSRAALMTGLRPDTSGITDLKTPVDEALPNAVTILDLFRSAGYQTLGYGKVYHHFEDDADGWTIRTEDYEHTLRREARRRGEPKLAAERAPDRASLPDTLNVGMALEKLPELAKSGQPFFMAVGIHRPHLPFVAPASDWDRYAAGDVPPPVNPNGQEGAPPWALVSYEVWNFDDTREFQPDMPDDKRDQLRWAYLASVSYADSLVGDLLNELKQQGLDDNTIVVLWGDHGWKIGDHKAWAKHSNADLDIHIPLIVRAPGQTRPGSRSNALVETVDIYPTLAELAGLRAPDRLEGLSMTPLFAQPELQWKSAAFARYDRNAGLTQGRGKLVGYTVRTHDYRYTAWVDKDGQVQAQELYDLARDPDESVNVAGFAGYRQAVKSLESLRLGGWKGALPTMPDEANPL